MRNADKKVGRVNGKSKLSAEIRQILSKKSFGQLAGGDKDKLTQEVAM